MAVTYDAGALAAGGVSTVRFTIGDTIENAGVLPNGGNFSDVEVAYALSAESSAQAASARLLRLAATRWMLVPQAFTADGLSVNRGEVSARLTLAAEALEQALVVTASTGTIESALLELDDLNSG